MTNESARSERIIECIMVLLHYRSVIHRVLSWIRTSQQIPDLLAGETLLRPAGDDLGSISVFLGYIHEALGKEADVILDHVEKGQINEAYWYLYNSHKDTASINILDLLMLVDRTPPEGSVSDLSEEE